MRTHKKRLPALSIWIRWLREKAGLTQAQLADRAGLAYSVVFKLEQGSRKEPGWDTVCKLADALGVEIGHFRRPIPESVPSEMRLPRPGGRPSSQKEERPN
jgi:transcriptional regulator with XRE-family HTH domain